MTLAFALAAIAAPEWITAAGGRVTRDAQGEITAVYLRGSFVSDADIEALARMPRLETIDLALTRITDLGLLRLKNLPNVRHLDLFFAELVTDEGLAVLKSWPKIETLNLRGTKVTDNTLALVAGKDSITALDVGYAEVTDSGLLHLPKLRNLRELGFGGNKMTEIGLEVLRALPSLTRLDIAGRQRTDSGLWFVAITDVGLDSITTLKDLRELNLSGTPISARGIERLKALPKLEKLNLFAARRLSDDAVPQLAALSGLKWVDLKDTAMTSEGFAALKKARPDLTALGDPAIEPRVTRSELDNRYVRVLRLGDVNESPEAPATVDIDTAIRPLLRVRVELKNHPEARFDGTRETETEKIALKRLACPSRGSCPANTRPAVDIRLADGAVQFLPAGAPTRFNEAPLPLELVRIEFK